MPASSVATAAGPSRAALSYVCSGVLRPARGRATTSSGVAQPSTPARSSPTRPAGIWRYRELLPVGLRRSRGLAVGGDAARLGADRLGEALGVDALLIKDDTRNPTLSFKDRAVAIATAKALALGLDALACASTGNLAGATAAAAAAAGLPAYVFVPADLEPAKIEHALAYGATVVPIDGTYDDVNRLCLEVADELGWGTVNVNLRPYYAEGSKTLAYEIAESLGWRLPDVVVAPIASGAMITRVARAFEELVELGWVARRRRPLRRRPGRRLLARRPGVRRSRGHGVTGAHAGHDRPLAGDRQPGRRAATRSSWPAGPAARSRRSTTPRPRTRSGPPRGSRACTRRRQAA